MKEIYKGTQEEDLQFEDVTKRKTKKSKNKKRIQNIRDIDISTDSNLLN